TCLQTLGDVLVMKSLFSRIATLVAVLSLSLGGLAITSPEPALAGLWVPDANECAFLKEINAYRKANGVPPVKLSRSLGAAADFHSVYMAKTDDVDHTLQSGLSWSSNIYNFGYPTGQGIGEN